MSELVGKIVGELRVVPGQVEEWERQRTENEDWNFPEFDSPSGLIWWLDSEANMARMAGEIEPTEEDEAIADFCLKAMRRIRDARDGT